MRDSLQKFTPISIAFILFFSSSPTASATYADSMAEPANLLPDEQQSQRYTDDTQLQIQQKLPQPLPPQSLDPANDTPLGAVLNPMAPEDKDNKDKNIHTPKLSDFNVQYKQPKGYSKKITLLWDAMTPDQVGIRIKGEKKETTKKGEKTVKVNGTYETTEYWKKVGNTWKHLPKKTEGSRIETYTSSTKNNDGSTDTIHKKQHYIFINGEEQKTYFFEKIGVMKKKGGLTEKKALESEVTIDFKESGVIEITSTSRVTLEITGKKLLKRKILIKASENSTLQRYTPKKDGTFEFYEILRINLKEYDAKRNYKITSDTIRTEESFGNISKKNLKIEKKAIDVLPSGASVNKKVSNAKTIYYNKDGSYAIHRNIKVAHNDKKQAASTEINHSRRYSLHHQLLETTYLERKSHHDLIKRKTTLEREFLFSLSYQKGNPGGITSLSYKLAIGEENRFDKNLKAASAEIKRLQAAIKQNNREDDKQRLRELLREISLSINSRISSALGIEIG